MFPAQPLRLELTASRPCAALIVLLHLAGAASLLTVMTGWAGGALACLIAALGIAAAWDRALLRSSGAPRAIELHAQGAAACLRREGPPLPLARPPASGVNRFWVSLPPAAGARRGLLIVRGMLPPDHFRLLRLWALWGRVAPGQRAG